MSIGMDLRGFEPRLRKSPQIPARQKQTRTLGAPWGGKNRILIFGAWAAVNRLPTLDAPTIHAAVASSTI
jgi:hypothetical protein